MPHDLEKAELLAIKQVGAGVANEAQQKKCLEVILYKFCGYYDMSFRPGGEEGQRATDFAEGKRFVASRIQAALLAPAFKESK